MFTRGFLGVVPTKLIETIVSICSPQEWPAVYVACSGTFRTERGLLNKFPGLEVKSNDVSLLSCALGAAGMGEALPFTFKGELEFIENHKLSEPEDRVASILLALNYSSYQAKSKDNRFKAAHREHMRVNFPAELAEARKMIDKVVRAMPISGYFGGDFRDHIEEAIQRRAGVIAYPPTFKGGYEKMFEFVHANADWKEPEYRMFDPAADVVPVLQRLEESGIPYFLYLDQQVEGFEPQVKFEARGARDIYGFGRAARSSFRAPTSKSKAFAYNAIDLAKVTAKSKLRALPVPEANISFLREAFLKKGIAFGTGDYGVLVFIDDMLVGAISYRKPLSAGQPLYVLTDLVITREGRLAKLIGRLATLHAVTRGFEHKVIARFKSLRTTAYSEYPEAMKYRGSWTVEKRTEVNGPAGRYEINYVSDVRQDTLDATFQWWWKRDGEREVAAARLRAEAPRSEDSPAS